MPLRGTDDSPVQLLRRTPCPVSILLAALLIWLPLASAQLPQVVTKQPAPAQKSPLTRLTQLAFALHGASLDLPRESRQRIEYATLSIVLLSHFNRLLPADSSPAEIDALAKVFLSRSPNIIEQNQAASTLPPADSLEFNGSKLGGGNFGNIDAIIGLGGLPIALDRELPARIVPLESSAAQGLTRAREDFQSATARSDSLPPEQIKDLYNRIHQANIAPQLVEDGLFMRPYAGRIDDLYHQLAQNGSRLGQLEFFGLLDSLPPRQYSPVSGTAARQNVPISRVNLSDILTGGSLQAIQKFRSQNPKVIVRNPFQGLAIRLIPLLETSIQESTLGTDLPVSRDALKRAITDPRRFRPPAADPLFKDPSRFLSQWEDPRFISVLKKKAFSNADLLNEIQQIDFETPLPEMNFEPAGNELIQLASPTPESEAHYQSYSSQTLLNDLGLPVDNDQVLEPSIPPNPRYLKPIPLD